MMRHIVSALFVQRSIHRAAYAGCWSFPGGHKEPGEILEETLVREVQEEVGVVPTTFAFVHGRRPAACTAPMHPLRAQFRHYVGGRGLWGGLDKIPMGSAITRGPTFRMAECGSGPAAEAVNRGSLRYWLSRSICPPA
jgi:hypothetical protein